LSNSDLNGAFTPQSVSLLATISEGLNDLPGTSADRSLRSASDIQHVSVFGGLNDLHLRKLVDRSPRSAIGTQRATALDTQRAASGAQRIPYLSERPNSDASFAISTVDDVSLPPSNANVLHADGISELLSSYPNRRFVDTLLSITLHGARVGFEGQPSG
jgi:hypothetical protein